MGCPRGAAEGSAEEGDWHGASQISGDPLCTGSRQERRRSHETSGEDKKDSAEDIPIYRM